MAILIRMPELLTGMTEASVQSWLVKVGDQLDADTPLAEIETEKAMVEFVAERSGTVVELLVSAGESVAVGEPIAILRDADDSDADVDAVRPVGDAQATSERGPGPVSAPPEHAHGPKPERSTVTGQPTSGRLFSSPIVRRVALERGIDLSQVTGTGPNGRIVRRDIDGLSAASATPPPSLTAQTEGTSAASSSSGPGEVIALTGMRKAIARRLTESKSTVPHFYLTANCQVDALLALRKSVNAQARRKISVNDFVVKAAARAFLDVPEANVIWGGEHILRYDTADIAVAMSTDGGLLTPVIRDINSLSLTDLSEAIAETSERARAGRIQQHELEGGSFAISNLGMYGVDAFSAILNPPQSGILAVGVAKEQPVVVDGQLAVGTLMTVTLSADHRVVDGVLGAQWLQAFKARVENPLSILI